MDVFFIYGLVDSVERSEIRYVGQTAFLFQRSKQHQMRCLWDSAPPSLWKRVMSHFGRHCEPVLIDVVYGTRAEAKDRELFHINRLAEETGRILNGTAYRRTQRRCRVPKVIVETYLDAFSMMMDGWNDGRFVNRNKAATIVDRLHWEYPSLAITDRFDKFSWCDRADGVLDSALVSR